MKLELRKAADGTHFVICVCSERMEKQLVIPLSPALSADIQRMVDAEGIKAAGLVLPPRLPAH